MSIFHCLVIDSTRSKEVTTEKPKLIPLCTSLRIINNPVLNLSVRVAIVVVILIGLVRYKRIKHC